jgi:hypothetical protein
VIWVIILFKNKSKFLIIGTVINTTIGIEIIVRVFYALIWVSQPNNLFDQDVLNISGIYLWFPQIFFVVFKGLVYFISAITLVLIIFEIATAMFSFKNNKKFWTVAHIILFVIICFLGEIFRGSSYLTFLHLWYIGTIFRIIGYFKQKKIDNEIINFSE